MSSRWPWFYVAVAIQLLILAAVPARKLLAAFTGTPVVLQVAPVDPYNILSGYYLTLSYEVARLSSEESQRFQGVRDLYVVVRPDPDGIWRRVAMTSEWPSEIPAGALVIKGTLQGWRLDLGLESFYLPETRRDAIAHDLEAHMDQARVEIRVDGRGNAVLRKLLIADRVYSF